MNGRKADVLIEEVTILGRIELEIWVDAGLRSVIESVPGINQVLIDNGSRYVAILDPRYEIEWVKAEIKARILIGAQS